MKKKQRHNCKYCGALYIPDYRSISRQAFCPAIECRKASHRLSQQRWLSKPENQNHFKDPLHVDRVRAWRKAHPGYWRKKSIALQDICNPQAPVQQAVAQSGVALQDICLDENPLFIGLVSHLTGALQENIDLVIENLQSRGQAVLGKGPGI